MKTLKNLKKNNKGFTLIEIIIVIVIIAILAAMLVPSMIKWIDNAKEKTFISDCSALKTAYDAAATEQYAIDGTKTVSADKLAALLDGATVAISDAAPTDSKTYNLKLGDDGAVVSVKNNVFTGTFDGHTWTAVKNDAG